MFEIILFYVTICTTSTNGICQGWKTILCYINGNKYYLHLWNSFFSNTNAIQIPQKIKLFLNLTGPYK